jgi:hypothetical protein
MTYDEVIQRFGTQVRLASVLGITQPTVSAWKGVIPKQYQFQIEVLTHGELKVDPELIPERVEQERRRQAAQGSARRQMG